jgi:hypothetical protein
MHGLLLLKRMRFIGLVHAWSTNTLKTVPGRPPAHPCFREPFRRSGAAHNTFDQTATERRYSFDVGATTLCFATNTVATKDVNRITYGTTQSLRSAASMFLKLDFQVAFPGEV